jgi:hypothetical protein
MMTQRHPDCPYGPEVCRVYRASHSVATLIAWTPIFDGNGMQLNSDPNTFVDQYACEMCDGAWTETRTGESVEQHISKAPTKA